jgi:small subunit ribosomal protein S13
MPRIAGIDLNNEKRIDIALTKIFGLGRKNVIPVLEKANVDPTIRVKNLTDEALSNIQKAVDSIKVEGDLRSEIHAHINTLKQIGSYRGTRHSHALPVRGQRTRSNARTKRGKRMTIGAVRKELAEKMAAASKDNSKK